MSFKNHNRPRFSYIAMCLLFILLSNVSLAQDHYIRAGANGDGSNWSQAWGALPSALVRGDTYYIADGIYSSYLFDDPEVEDQYIYIKKATASNHGTDIGWNNDWGDGQAAFNLSSGDVLWRFTTGYYIIDGQTGVSFTNWDNRSGFVLTSSTGVYESDILIYLGTNNLNNSPSNITFQNIELTFPEEAEPSLGGSVVCYGIYSMKTGPYFSEGYGAKQIAIKNCFFNHIQKPIKASYGSDWLLEESYFKDNWSNPVGSNQGEAWEEFGSDRCLIRNNYFENIIGSGVFGLKGNFCSVVSDWEITGNIFYWTGTTGNGIGDAVIVYTNNCNPGIESDSRVGGFRIYNNSFYSSGSAFNYAGIVGLYDADKNGNPNYFYNNTMYDCRGNVGVRIWGIEVDATGAPINSSGARDYNTWISCGNIYQGIDSHDTIVPTGEDPFIDAVNKNFALKEPSAGGYNNSTILQYNKDGFGRTRGEDGTWDRGSVEHVNSNPTVQTYTLNVSVVGNGSITVTPEQQFYTAAQPVTLQANPDQGNIFVNWTGSLTETTPVLTFTINSNVTLVAHFEEIPGQTDAALPASVINWKLIENEGVTAKDYSSLGGFSHAQFRNNPLWTTGGGLSFNGVNSYLEATDSDFLEITQPVTFSAWIKLNSYSSWAKVLIKPHSSFASPWEMYAIDLGSNGRTPRFVVTDGIENGSESVVSSTQTININQWYNIVGTYDGSSIRLYLDGQLQATQAVNFTIGSNAMPLCIGGRLGTNTIDGNLSDIRIYNECLTTEQVNALYDHKRNDGLINSLDITDQSSPDFDNAVVKDSSGNNLDGLFINDPSWGDAWAQKYSLLFNGTNQAVEISCDSMQTEAGTIAMKVQPSSATDTAYLFGHSLNSTQMIYLYTVAGKLALGLGNELVVDSDIATLSAGTLYHVALTWNGTDYTVYVDGQEASSGTFSGLTALAAAADIANMGTDTSRSQGLGFDGIVDDVQIYSRALSAQEITALFNTQETKENRMLTFFISGQDQNGSPYTYTAQNLPTGATFDQSEQKLTWRPWYDQAGDHQVLFISLDGADEQTITLSVKDVTLKDWYRDFLAQNSKL